MANKDVSNIFRTMSFNNKHNMKEMLSVNLFPLTPQQLSQPLVFLSVCYFNHSKISVNVAEYACYFRVQSLSLACVDIRP
jgi:hypothetical protein